jgi:hypothetical protein
MNPSEYHLPNNAYWVCNSKYNGLSQISKLDTTRFATIGELARISKLK